MPSSTVSGSTDVLGMFIAAVAACCWGFVYATSQRITAAADDDVHIRKRKLTPLQLMTLCFLLGSMVMVPVAALIYHPLWDNSSHRDHAEKAKLQETELVISTPTLKEFAVFTMTLMAAEYLVFYSVSLLGGTEASLIQVSYPIWTGLSLYITQGETPSKSTIVGACFILVGVVIITVYGGNPESDTMANDGRVEEKSSGSTESGRLIDRESKRQISYEAAKFSEGAMT